MDEFRKANEVSVRQFEYENWENRIAELLKKDGETDEFILYLLGWFRGIDGRAEANLIEEFHPKIDTEEEAYSFINMVRSEPLSVIKNRADFQLYMFDSAFFLYRPFLKLSFYQEEK